MNLTKFNLYRFVFSGCFMAFSFLSLPFHAYGQVYQGQTFQTDLKVNITLPNHSSTSSGSGGTVYPTLTNDQRRAFLEYYAPLILKAADEPNTNDKGNDWISNLNFDQDNNFSNNRTNWLNEKIKYLDPNQHLHSDWQIRPTIYTALIEFMNSDKRYNWNDPSSSNKKSLVLLYHIYHPKHLGSIHSWERIEIRLDNIDASGEPGLGEMLNYVVISEGGNQLAVNYPNQALLNFYGTRKGQHLIFWQDTNGGLHYPVASKKVGLMDEIVQNNKGQVYVHRKKDLANFHYIFVNKSDDHTVVRLNAATITQGNGMQLAAGHAVSFVESYNNVKRITYELQDIADILPTQMVSKGTVNWGGASVPIVMNTPVMNENATVQEISAANNSFYSLAKDGANLSDKNYGYISQDWFWGTFTPGYNAPFLKDVVSAGLNQHDYFMHLGGDIAPTVVGKDINKLDDTNIHLDDVINFAGDVSDLAFDKVVEFFGILNSDRIRHIAEDFYNKGRDFGFPFLGHTLDLTSALPSFSDFTNFNFGNPSFSFPDPFAIFFDPFDFDRAFPLD